MAMASTSKIVRSTIIPTRIKSAGHVLRYCSSTADDCRSGSGGCKKCSGKTGGRDKIPCLLCPTSGGTDNPSAPTIYDVRKVGHNISTDSTSPCFETLPDIPTGVFRCTTGEVLGRGAGKCTYYQNPEYFSYHHMSFYDFNLYLRQYRIPCPKTGRKPL